MTPEEQLRYYLFSRSKIDVDVVHAMLLSILPPATALDDTQSALGENLNDVLTAISAGAKTFAAQVVDTALSIARDAAPHDASSSSAIAQPPLAAHHVQEAFRRLVVAGQFPGQSSTAASASTDVVGLEQSNQKHIGGGRES